MAALCFDLKLISLKMRMHKASYRMSQYSQVLIRVNPHKARRDKWEAVIGSLIPNHTTIACILIKRYHAVLSVSSCA